MSGVHLLRRRDAGDEDDDGRRAEEKIVDRRNMAKLEVRKTHWRLHWRSNSRLRLNCYARRDRADVPRRGFPEPSMSGRLGRFDTLCTSQERLLLA